MQWTLGSSKTLFGCRGAELYAEDERLYIPVMVASEFKRTEAFCCLMEYMKELNDGRKNPLFKVLGLEANDLLEVS